MTEINPTQVNIVADASRRSPSPNPDPKPTQDLSVEVKKAEPIVERLQVEVEDRSNRGEEAVQLTSETISPEKLADLVKKLQDAMPATENALQFRIDEVLGRAVVSVIDENSGEVIRQLPSDEVVRAAHNIEYMRGVLFDRRY